MKDVINENDVSSCIENIEKSYTQSNRMLEACYSMTLNEKRLLMLIATKINPMKQQEWDFKITAREFADNFDIGERTQARDLLKAVRLLYERNIHYIEYDAALDNAEIPSHIEKPEGLQLVSQDMRWIDSKQSAIYGDNNNSETYVLLSIPTKIQQFLANFHLQMDNGYTRTQFLQAKRLKSVYSIRLFEWLSRFKDTGYFLISPDDLRAKLNLTGKYVKYNHLKARVIYPALIEINKQTNFKVRATEFKKSRKVEMIKFIFELDQQTAFVFDSEEQKKQKKVSCRSTRNISIEEKLRDTSWSD